MPGFHSTFSTGLLKVNFGGQDLSAGMGEDNFLNITRSSERFQTTGGLDGNHAVNVSLDNSATITLTYFVTSDTAKTLKNLYQVFRVGDREGPNLGKAAFSVTDPSGVVMFAAKEAALRHIGDEQYGAGATTIDVIFFTPELLQVAVDEKVAGAVNDIAAEAGFTTTAVTAAGTIA